MHDEDVKTPVFLSHRETLRAVARKYLIHKEDVDDALQELFIRSWGSSSTTALPCLPRRPHAMTRWRAPTRQTPYAGWPSKASPDSPCGYSSFTLSTSSTTPR